jgi:hypothetical protein
MEFDFIYSEQCKQIVGTSTTPDIPMEKIKGIHLYAPEEKVMVNLNAEQYKDGTEDDSITELCATLHHEYLHKAIFDIRKELGLEDKGRVGEERIVTKLAGENFVKELEKYYK